MHGHFFSRQHYLQQPPQTSPSAGVQRAGELPQHGQIHFQTQAGLANGQAFQGHGNQHRIHPMHHSDITQQQYALLQTQLYNQAIQQQQQQQQQQSSTSRQHQERQRLLQHQLASANDQTLRNLLSNPAIQQLQMQSLNQLGMRPTTVSPHHLQQMELLQQQAAKNPRYHEETLRARIEQQQRQEHERQEALSRSQVNVQGLQQNPSVINPELLLQHRLPTLSNQGRSPPGYRSSQNPNYLQNLMMSSQGNTAPTLLSPQHPKRYPSPTVTHRGQPTTVALQEPRFASYGVSRQSQDLQSPRRTTPTGAPPSSGVTKTSVHVKRQTPSVSSSTAPVIISDSDDDEFDRQVAAASKMPQKQNVTKEETKTNFTPVVIDDDIEITGFKEADIMSHMRPDCPLHDFTRIDDVAAPPQGLNGSRCDKCYCYICDALAKDCGQWTNRDRPHCNAHARASCWKARRNVKKSPLMNKLPSDEITQEMSDAGELALHYMIKIREYYITYRAGIPCDYHNVPCDCSCHKTARSHREDPCGHCKGVHDMKKRYNYEPVRDVALSIIREIKTKYSQDRPLTALITLEAVLSELCSQRPADFNHTMRRQSNPDPRCQCNFPTIIEEHIEKELISILTCHEVTPMFLKHLNDSVVEAIKPLQLKDIMKKFMSMKHWDDLLLRAVLSGSNTTGTKGREHLRETGEVIRHRVEKLDREKKYLSILRYLKAVKVFQTGKVGDDIHKDIERWKIIYSIRQGRFREVIQQLIDTILWKNFVAHHSMDFFLQVLDNLTKIEVPDNIRVDSFENKSPPFVISGRDADAIVFLVLLLLHHNSITQDKLLACLLWFVRWVNRISLVPSLDPENTRRWITEGNKVIEIASRAMIHGSPKEIYDSLASRDPHVHVLVASICIMNRAMTNPDIFGTEQRMCIIEAYSNNEWALFLLVTQARMNRFRDNTTVRWITKFCDANNRAITQIHYSVIEEAIKRYPLNILVEFIAALIKPDWIHSSDQIQLDVFRILSIYSIRLFEESRSLERSDLMPKVRWLEEIFIKPFKEQRIKIIPDKETLKIIVKHCCFLNPTRHNVELLQGVSGNQWPHQCSNLIMMLSEKQNQDEHFIGTLEEFTLLLCLLWCSDRVNEMGKHLIKIQDKHICDATKTNLPTDKIIDEVANLLDSNMVGSVASKVTLCEMSRRLCVVETLSWLTCTECATKMSTHWMKVWLSISRLNQRLCIEALNKDMLDQFKVWLNRIGLDVPESYERLMKCLRSFLGTLVTVWQQCAITLEEARTLLSDVATNVIDPRFQRDLHMMAVDIVQSEIDRLRPPPPKVPENLPHRPSNDIHHQQSHQMVQRALPPPSPHQNAIPNPPHQNPIQSPPHQNPIQSPPHRNPIQSPPHQNHPLPSPRGAAPNPPHGHMAPSHFQHQNPPHGHVTPIQNQPHRRISTEARRRPSQDHVETLPAHSAMQKGQSSNSIDRRSSVEHRQQSKTNAMDNQTLRSPEPPKRIAHSSEIKQNGPISIAKPESTFNRKNLQGDNQHSRPKPPPKDEAAPFSPTNLSRTKSCPNCKSIISCALFRCPNCNKPTRTVQPVICPGCHQENLEVKKYSCEFCYRSLIDVMFGGQPAETKQSQEPTRTKKKSVDRRRKKSKTEEMKMTTTTTIITEITPSIPESPPKDPPKKTEPEKVISPPKILQKQTSTSDNSESSSDDFVIEPPPKKRVKPSISNKMQKLSKKPSNPLPVKSSGASLTDSESDSTSEENEAPKYPNSNEVNHLKPKQFPNINVTKKFGTSPQKVVPEKRDISPKPPPQPKANIMSNNKPRNDEPMTSQKPIPPQSKNIPSAANVATSGPKKRGVGHSSAMSKTQKKLLSRFQKMGKGAPKFAAKTHPQNKPKEQVKTPGTPKRNFGNDFGPFSSPTHQLGSPERINHDSSQSSIGSTSGLSFTLATVRPKNVGHRTGGPPGKGKRMDGVVPHPPSKDTLFPQPLNDCALMNNAKRRKIKRKELMKQPAMLAKRQLEKKLIAAFAKRKPGPAKQTNYRKIHKIEKKLQKLRRPSKLWKVPPSVKIPEEADLSLYMRVSLSSYPADKLRRIQSLVPRHKLSSLFA